jgi:hypothetical protein
MVHCLWVASNYLLGAFTEQAQPTKSEEKNKYTHCTKQNCLDVAWWKCQYQAQRWSQLCMRMKMHELCNHSCHVKIQQQESFTNERQCYPCYCMRLLRVAERDEAGASCLHRFQHFAEIAGAKISSQS